MSVTDTRTPLRAFIAQQGITMSSDYADRNPNLHDDRWAATHWRIVFRKGRQRLTTYFSQGAAHTDRPSIEDVLNCLADDAAGIENARDFDDWCAEYGYETDSRTAERTFKSCQRAAGKLERFLGDRETYEMLLFQTERH